MAKYEGSKADRRQDARSARKAGMSTKNWEQSPQDEQQDRMARAQSNAGPSKPRLGRPPLPDYEQSPAMEKAGRKANHSVNDAMGAPPPDSIIDA